MEQQKEPGVVHKVGIGEIVVPVINLYERPPNGEGVDGNHCDEDLVGLRFVFFPCQQDQEEERHEETKNQNNSHLLWVFFIKRCHQSHPL